MLSIFGEDGQPLKTLSGDSLFAITNYAPPTTPAINWDSVNQKHYVEFQFNASTREQYARAYWLVTTPDNVTVNIDGYTPEDIRLVPTAVQSPSPELVPLTYFIEGYLAVESKLDARYKAAVEAYINQDRNNLREILKAAVGNLQDKTEIYFTPTKAVIERDMYSQDFRTEWWLQQTDYVPIISVDKYELIYGTNPPLNVTSDIAAFMKFEPNMGTIEFVPTAIGGSLWTALISNLSGLGLASYVQGGFPRVPLLFHIEYTHGLDFFNLSEAEKAKIRNAICRNALITILPMIDPYFRVSSRSISIDGASKSYSAGQLLQILKDLREDEQKFVDSLRRKYARNVPMVVV